MKPQDLLFIIIFIFLIWRRDPKWLVVTGLISFLLAIPLFHLWIFFTAERLIWYALAFILVAVVVQLPKKPQK